MPRSRTLRDPRWLLPILWAVLALGLALRLRPHYRWALWGSDTGEYLRLTQALVENGQLLESGYRGWGLAYPYFQGMELWAGGAALLTGQSHAATLLWLVPVAGALALPALFLLARWFTTSRAALIATAFYATLFPAVFANSHPMPGGLADPLGLLLLLAWCRWLTAPRWTGVMAVLLAGLLLTHHFTLLLMAAAATGVLVVEIAAGNRAVATRGVTGLGAGAAVIAAYWVGYAAPFRERILGEALLPLPLLLLFPLAALAGLWLLRSRLALPRIVCAGPQAIQRRPPVAFVVLLAVIALVLWRGLPGTTIPVGTEALPYLLPPLGWLALASVPSLLMATRRGWLVCGWALPIAALAAVGGATGSHLLIGYRHAPYLLAALAVLVGVGGERLVQTLPCRGRPAVAAGLALLTVAAGLGAYPPPAVMGGFQEGTSQSEVEAVLWLRQAEPGALVVSDHRLSSMAFGLAGRDASWENGGELINGDLATALAEGERMATPSSNVPALPVAYVLLSDEVARGVALEQWNPAEPISSEAAAKFGGEHFPVWFDNGEARCYRFVP